MEIPPVQADEAGSEASVILLIDTTTYWYWEEKSVTKIFFLHL